MSSSPKQSGVILKRSKVASDYLRMTKDLVFQVHGIFIPKNEILNLEQRERHAHELRLRMTTKGDIPVQNDIIKSECLEVRRRAVGYALHSLNRPYNAYG
jgi:hypothetical protein